MYLSFIDDAFDRADNSSCPCPKGLKKLSDISDQNEGLKGREKERERERDREREKEIDRDRERERKREREREREKERKREREKEIEKERERKGEIERSVQNYRTTSIVDNKCTYSSFSAGSH